ncbi:biogenesis of lysosome-related organelles complex 1 subunit 3 [Piliocolobus tephrosceles]|uniref:Biogenesis of lysosome-related organelles complex 1 subunit 3 n=1 Tax=Piliocolobus tephrosceles TaxID=591936 RepID=A0A8C9INY5_9PRIM|nr:biogenesis of lysosome-related organelles complex 1 subunit 3 [Piliocolobus tephrosceles]XP_023038175.1 biogenesis of lysosome-related organelles complex 1 subunit 3 [Piliocolobus tephrosceles]
MASQGRRRRPLRRPETVVPGEATETDSEPSVSSSEEEELYLGPSGPTRGRPTGLRVAGEAAETDSDPEPEPTAAPRDLPPLVVQRQLAEEAWGAEEAPAPAPARSLLQLRLAESQARLDHDVAAAVSGVYRRAGRDVAALAGRLAAAQAAGLAAAHSVRLARGDLCALAERLDIVAGCRLLPDIRGVPGTKPEQDPGPRA